MASATSNTHQVHMNATLTAITSYEINGESQDTIKLTKEIFDLDAMEAVSICNEASEHSITVSACKTAYICKELLIQLADKKVELGFVVDEKTLKMDGIAAATHDVLRLIPDIPGIAPINSNRKNYGLAPLCFTVENQSNANPSERPDSGTEKGKASNEASSKTTTDITKVGISALIGMIAGMALMMIANAYRR